MGDDSLPVFGGALASLVAPLAESEFLKRYFRRRVRFQRGGPKRLTQLRRLLGDFDVETLTRSSENLAVWWHDGKYADQAVSRQRALEAYRHHATLYFDANEPRCRALAARIAKQLDLPTGRLSIFVTRSSNTSLHYDRNENFTIQLSGRKEWWVSRGPVVENPCTNHFQAEAVTPEARHDMNGQPAPTPERLRRHLMTPGDMLYVPAGTWHSTRASSPSISLNLMFPPLPWHQHLLRRVESHLKTMPHWRAGIGARPSSTEIEPKLAELREVLGLLSAQDFTSEPRRRRPGSPLQPSTKLRRCIGTQISWTPKRDMLDVNVTWAHDASMQRFKCGREARRVLGAVATAPREFTCQDLAARAPELDLDDVLRLAELLRELGAVQERADRSCSDEDPEPNRARLNNR